MGTREMGMSWDRQNCYFHSGDMTCLHQHHELVNVTIEDVYMDNKNFKMLKEENKEELKRRNHWEAVLDGVSMLNFMADFKLILLELEK